MLVRSDGSVLTKDEVLADLRTQKISFERIEVSDEEVRIIDSVAVLTGQSRTRSRHAGTLMQTCFRFIALYQKDPGGLNCFVSRALRYEQGVLLIASRSEHREMTFMDIKTLTATDALFLGAWALQSFTEMLSDGSYVEPMGRSPQGFLLYTEQGIVSAQLTGRTSGSDELSAREAGASGGDPKNEIPYIGYCGTFTVNLDPQEIVHIPLVAHDRSLVGNALRRKFHFNADRLTLRI
jgi:hypothetical protein